MKPSFRTLLGWLSAAFRRAALRFRPSSRRLELAWTGLDRAAIEGLALASRPREGAVIALCYRSTGASRDTFIVSSPITPGTGDLSYHRGPVVTVTARYWNRAIDAVSDKGSAAGLMILHTHPGEGIPEWSADDDRADTGLASFLFGEGFLVSSAPLVSLVASHSAIRGRCLSMDGPGGRVTMRPIERVRTVGRDRIEVHSTVDRAWPNGKPKVPEHADRSIRVFGKEGQLLLADLHVALIGAGGVGSICGEHLARWGIGELSIWDPDVVKRVNINRSGVFTFLDAVKRRLKVTALAHALPRVALAPTFRMRTGADVRRRSDIDALLDADVILMLVDDARPRHFINRLAYAHYIPALDGGNAIRSTAEDDGHAETATIEGGGVRVSHLTPGGPCLWCAGHLTAQVLSLAYRPESDKAADRARGYVEHLGPEHAPSVMPVNSMTAAFVEYRLQDLLFGLSRRVVPEVHFDFLQGTLDELPRTQLLSCRNCARSSGVGDSVELPFSD